MKPLWIYDAMDPRDEFAVPFWDGQTVTHYETYPCHDLLCGCWEAEHLNKGFDPIVGGHGGGFSVVFQGVAFLVDYFLDKPTFDPIEKGC